MLTERNLLAIARNEHRQLRGALIRTAFARPDHDRARVRLGHIVGPLVPFVLVLELARGFGGVADDLFAYTGFPSVNRPKICPCNPTAVSSRASGLRGRASRCDAAGCLGAGIGCWWPREGRSWWGWVVGVVVLCCMFRSRMPALSGGVGGVCAAAVGVKVRDGSSGRASR